MHLSKTFSVLRRLSVLNRHAPQALTVKRRTSTASKTTVEEMKSQESAVGEQKKTIKGPFIKNLFVGCVDAETLEYPEYPSMEYIRELDSLTVPVEEYFLNCVQPQTIDETKEIPNDVLNSMKEHNLYGLQAPKHLGGWEVDDKCFARYFESIGTDNSIVTYLTAHYRALNVLSLFGTVEQKEKLITRMTSGELNVAVCITEKPSILNLSDIDTCALPNKDDNWTLNGKKLWIPNGDKADYFLVFAKTWRGSLNLNTNSELTVFLVPKDAAGVECSANIEQLGTRGVGLCDITFNNVTIPKENIVGELGDGSNIAVQCLSKGRLASAASAVGYLKNLLSTVSEFTAQTKIENKALYTLEYYQKQLGEIAIDIYALESMVYLTAGLKDMYDNPDLTMEETAVKVYSIEKTVEIVNKCASLIGGSAYIKGSPLEIGIRDAQSYLMHDVVPLNVTKLHMVTLGLHHAGLQMEKEVKKARNPFNFPAFALKNFFNESKVLQDEIKVPEELRLVFHPSLSGDADKLESCAIRLECIVKNLFTRWGIEVIDRHTDLIKVADCVVAMYAMAAVISRSSRAYCIGLTNSNYDLSASNTVCGVNYEKIKRILEMINDGPMAAYDKPCTAIGEQIALQKGYFFQHPLARNY